MKRRCARCIYLLHPARVHPLRDGMEGQLILPLCLNHAATPGELREVHPCECCRNFEARPEPCLPPVPPGPEVKYIPLGHHQFAIVDAADYEWLKEYKWRFLGGDGVLGYAYRCEHGKRIFMHREIMRTPPGQVADHKDHNPLDNRRCNLRNCNRQQNSCNCRRARNQSGFVGVQPYGKRWLAKIRSGGKTVYSEVFDDKVEAAKARDRQAYELFGPFAYLNFPEEIRAIEVANPPLLGPRYIELSGSARARCCARATLTVIHAGRVA
jgi:hypothetical protein